MPPTVLVSEDDRQEVRVTPSLIYPGDETSRIRDGWTSFHALS
jgi:hypothetical protein